jgi:hypothetical protein
METECTANCGPLPRQTASNSLIGTGLVLGMPRRSIQQEKTYLTPAASSISFAAAISSLLAMASAMVAG